MRLKWYILLVMLARVAVSLGQGKNTPGAVVVSDASGNKWQRTVQTTIRPQPSQPVIMYPSGDILLPRFKSKSIHYEGIQPGDTLRCIIVSKTGSPFKQVSILFNGTPSIDFRNVDSAGYFQCPPANGFSIQIKSKALSLSRQVAIVKVSRIPPTHFDTLVNTTDVLLKPADSLAQPVWRSTSTSGIQTAWYGSLSTGHPDEQIKRKKDLIVQSKPAVRTQLSPAGVTRVRSLKETKLIYRDFLPGDTLVYYAKSRGKGLFASASLFDQDSTQLSHAINTPVFQGVVVVSAEKAISLILKSKLRLKKDYADVAVWRIRPMPSDTFYQVTDSLFRSKTETFYDTTGLTILDDSLLVAPLWNLEAGQTASMTVQAPTELVGAGKLDFIVYWYGPDRPYATQYSWLEASVPAAWSLPGLPPALGAYALGHKLALPEARLDKLESAFTSARDQALFLRNKAYQRLLPVFPNFGKVKASDLNKWGLKAETAKKGEHVYKFYLCFRNLSTVDTYQPFLKVVGIYTKVKNTVTTQQFIQTNTRKEPLSK